MYSRILIIALISLATGLSAQIDFGVKAVYSYDLTSPTTREFVNVDPFELAQLRIVSAEPTRGIGISLYTENDKLFLMGDVLYTRTGRNFELLSVDKDRTLLDPAVSLNTTESNVRLAINTGFRTNKFKVGVGPELSLRLENEESLSTLANITNNGSTVQGGFNFLVGYKLTQNIHIDLKHTYIFQDVGNEFAYGNIPLELKTNQKSLELSVGLYF